MPKRKGKTPEQQHHDEYGLTVQQRRCADIYLADPRRLGYRAFGLAFMEPDKRKASAGWSRLKASQYFSDYIGLREQEELEKLQFDAQAALKERLEYLRADVADLYDEGGQLLPLHEWPYVFRRMVNIEFEQGISGDKLVDKRKIKFIDREKILQGLEVHRDVQARKETVEVQGNDALIAAIYAGAKRARVDLDDDESSD